MMLHYHSTSIFTLLCLLSISVGIPSVAAEAEITIDDYYAKIAPTAALPGFNVEGGSVFTNLVNTINAGQLFFIRAVSVVFEKPETDPVRASFFSWCSDLTFSDIRNSSTIGYAGRCVSRTLAGYADAVASGAQFTYEFTPEKFQQTAGISTVYVEQTNVFEGQFHAATDDWAYRYWDDGRKTVPMIAWEGHDEGDLNPNAATSSFSAAVEVMWMSVEEAAQLFNVSADEFTPEKFKQVYSDTWIKGHEEEAAEKNPNPEPELEIIEQVKNETNYVDETTAPAQPDSTPAEDVDSDGTNPVVEEDDSGSGRQLMSIAARVVSAALRVFGI